jgi:hypothetical protein
MIDFATKNQGLPTELSFRELIQELEGFEARHAVEPDPFPNDSSISLDIFFVDGLTQERDS